MFEVVGSNFATAGIFLGGAIMPAPNFVRILRLVVHSLSLSHIEDDLDFFLLLGASENFVENVFGGGVISVH